MAPCTRSQTKRVAPTPSSPPQSNAKTQPKANANTQPKAKEETQPKAEDEPQPKFKDETQPEGSSAGQVPETQPKGSNAGQVSEKQPEEKVPSIPEDLPKVQPLRDHGLSMLRESNAMTPHRTSARRATERHLHRGRRCRVRGRQNDTDAYPSIPRVASLAYGGTLDARAVA